MIAEIDSVFDLMAALLEKQSCLGCLQEIRWQDGEFRPYSGSTCIHHFTDRKIFKCADCEQWFSIKAGTIFEDTKLPLRKWLIAGWLIMNQPRKVVSAAMAKDLKITQKTACFVLHRLRHAIAAKSFSVLLSRAAEFSTACVGGKS